MSFPRGHMGHFGGQGYTVQSVLFQNYSLASLSLILNEILACLVEKVISARHSHIILTPGPVGLAYGLSSIKPACP